MSINKPEVDKIANLARLAISENDRQKYEIDLKNIFEVVDEINQVDTTDVLPLAHPLEATQRLRADQVTETNQRDYFQQNAPLVKNGLYLVPKVIEEH